MLGNQGFDSSKIEKSDDFLNRWAFAEDIYHLAQKTPPERAVRIGIYGGWGEGKTTVLNYVSSMAKKDANTVLWFNPWRFATVNEMWASFVHELYGALKKNGIKIDWVDKTKGWFNKQRSKLSAAINPAKDAAAFFHPVAGAGAGFIKMLIDSVQSSMPEYSKYLKDKRVYIFIDDLDRANIEIVPQILYALKELLDLPGFTFILAFDPLVIQRIYKHHYSEEEYGKDFLDKIIDFPKWLPSPEEKGLLALARYETEKYVKFIPFSAFESVFSFFDKNPRKLKQLIRLFIGFDKELDRYDERELNRELFLLINIFKIKYPRLAEPILSSDNIQSAIFKKDFLKTESDPIPMKIGTGDKSEKESDDVIEIKSICSMNKQTANIDDIVNLTQTIFRLDKGYSPESKKNIAQLTERPAIMTWKEFNKIAEEFERQEVKNLSALLRGHVKNSGGYSEREQILTFFNKSIDAYDHVLREVTDSDTHEEWLSKMGNAKNYVSLIKNVSLDMGGFTGAVPFLGADSFHRLYEKLENWINVTKTDEDKESRSTEREILIAICNNCTTNAPLLLDTLKPWYLHRDPFSTKEKQALQKELSGILERHVCEAFVEKWNTPNWIQNIWLGDKHDVEKYCLLRAESPIWQGDMLRRFNEMTKADNKSVRRNAFSILELLGELYIFSSGTNTFIEPKESILERGDIILSLWNSATKDQIGYRYFHRLEALREGILKKFNHDLPKPKWWDEVKQLIENQSVKNPEAG